MNDPLHRRDAELATVDEPTLMALYEEASRSGDGDALEPLVRQLVLRAVPVVHRTAREFGAPRGLSDADLELVEDEALTKFVLRLGRGAPVASIRALAYELTRECAEDPERRPRPPRRTQPPRPRLKLVDGGLAERARTNGKRMEDRNA